jgi:uncharacterized protein with FMN-binding domain
MRRSTAAAVGTLTGAALIIGVRLSVSAPELTAAPPAADLVGGSAGPEPSATKKPPSKKPDPDAEKTEEAPPPDEGGEAAADESGLKDGTYKGAAVKNPYGTITVSIKVTGGRIVAADATFPLTNDSATINPPAIAALKQSTVKAQSADVDAVSGATFTSASYVKSLQAALDQAGA